MLRQLGNIAGCFWSLFFPFRMPKRDYIRFTLVKCLFLAMMPLTKLMG